MEVSALRMCALCSSVQIKLQAAARGMKSLFDGSDLIGIVHPKDTKCLRYVRFWLRTIGSWPGRAVGEERTTLSVLFTFFNLFIPALAWSLNVAFAIKHFRIWTFFEMDQVYVNTIMCSIFIVRQILPLTSKYEKLVGQFMNEIHLFHHKHKSDYAMKMHLYIHKLSYLYTIYVIGAMLWGYTLYNMIPLYNNWVRGGYESHMPENFTYEYSVDYEVPFDYLRDFRVHIFLFIFDLYTGMTCSTCICVIDLLIALQMFHLWGHLKILIYNMENFPRPVHRYDGLSQRVLFSYTAEEQKDVSQALKDIVSHHNLILRNIKNISNTFGPYIAAYYVYYLFSNCVLLLEISSLDTKALIRYGPLALINLQLQLQISAVFELLSSMTEKLIRAAYNLPWECMDVRNRRAVLVILARCQLPLGLKAVGIIEVGMKTSVAILKTTLSYFIMLRTLE